ncbi:class II glutamine amidotransferase [Thermodesulfovibrionales bacterium]|nr:class II glutamine amidotransferase [Thermodesulfovibrionales bacterium]MCL0038476.1 class II glutamine amidotransferase [Thermodesulfovibrionales bacterium]MCL0042388.1 class II glutamine amidotransferase [Thermodesulfovibrionales bacterium]MCL0061861.1 class II glutamine amidotransferase [Thermodesulfovibrionales bacterium]MCL0107074.1 class II glutamine amidotransferase [Thermodesulfovibrionales bacterium]
MCELFGLNFNQPIQCSLSFRGFRHRGKHNPDGWGIARFDGRDCQVFKEPIKAPNSKLATFLRDYESFVSKIFIGHVRYASRGNHTLQNTHPFSRTFRSRKVVLAHNGTLDPVIPEAALKFHPVGETDSEYLLCALLTMLSEERIRFTDFQRIEAVLRKFNRFGNMNLLFSEGDHLYSYRDHNRYNGLCITKRTAPFDRVSLRDEDWKVDLAEEKHPDQRGFVIATHPLTNEKWNDMLPGSLRVFKDGQCVYGV